MKRLLLDTHVLLWWLADDPKLGPQTVELISDPQNEIFVSAASSWEIAIKKKLGKLEAPDYIDTAVEDEGFSKLPISLHNGEAAGTLPLHHKDPFDRMLVAQAQVEGLRIITDDSYRSYAVNTPPALSRWLRLTAKAGVVSFADSLRFHRQL